MANGENQNDGSEYDKQREAEVKDEKDKIGDDASNDEKNAANKATAPEGQENIDIVHREEKQEAEELASSKVEEDTDKKEEKKLLNPVEILPGVFREGLLKDDQIGEDGPAPHTPSPTVSPQPDPLKPETTDKV